MHTQYALEVRLTIDVVSHAASSLYVLATIGHHNNL